jgi:MSHA pilin protein MshC
MQNKSGFTLIELVIVIILLGILSATAIPRLIGNKGFEAQTYRDQLQQLLKTVQQQAMSCDATCLAQGTRTANPYACNKVIITTTRYGIPTNCDTLLPATFAAPHLGMSSTEANGTAVRFSSHTVAFNSQGINTNCTSGCDISIIGDQTLLLRIESQGFIHEK